jgi:methyl-accepting chemotaxis protein
VEPRSEQDVLGHAFQRMVANLRDLVQQVQVAASGVAEGSERLGEAAGQSGEAVQQVATAVQQVAQGAQEQCSSAQESSRSVEQLLDAIGRVAAAPTRRHGP